MITVTQELFTELLLSGVKIKDSNKLRDKLRDNYIEREAFRIINTYYDALGNSSEYEDGDRNEKRMEEAIEYYYNNYNTLDFVKTYITTKLKLNK
jgi:hypothetical protein